jgi:hypothetical protein
MPWFFFSVVLCLVNVIFNILLNQWWAEANALLIFNSVYLFVQTVLSWPLLFEIPLYLNEMRIIRYLSVAVSVVYMMVYLFIVLDWVYMLYLEPEKDYESYDLFSIF